MIKFLGTSTVVRVLESLPIFRQNIFAVLKGALQPHHPLPRHLWSDCCSTRVYHTIIHRTCVLVIYMNSIPWQPGTRTAGVFKLGFFSMAGVTVVREKSFSRLSPRESTGAEEGVCFANTQASLWKKEQALTSDQTVRARNIILIPFINIHFCLSNFQLLLLCERYFYCLFITFAHTAFTTFMFIFALLPV